MEIKAALPLMRILVEMINPIRVKEGTAALYTVDLVALQEEQLGEIRSILPRDTGNQSLLHSPLPFN
jgi:hypothetical protein